MDGLRLIGVAQRHPLNTAEDAQVAAGIYYSVRHSGPPQGRDGTIDGETLGNAAEVESDIRTEKSHPPTGQDFHIGEVS